MWVKVLVPERPHSLRRSIDLDLVRRIMMEDEQVPIVIIQDATRRVRKQITSWRLRKEGALSLYLLVFLFLFLYPFRIPGSHHVH